MTPLLLQTENSTCVLKSSREEPLCVHFNLISFYISFSIHAWVILSALEQQEDDLQEQAHETDSFSQTGTNRHS